MNNALVGLPRKARKYDGFTIVELIIVIVVIGILTGIVAVSYTAIIKESRNETVRTDARGAAAAAVKYRSDTGRYAEAADLLALPNAESTIQYDGNAAENTFCVTATLDGVGWYVASGSSVPKEGTCFGHGINGNRALVNYVKDPSVATLNGIGSVGSSTLQLMTNGGRFGQTYARGTITSGTAGIAVGEHEGYEIPVRPGRTYTVSAYLRGGATAACTSRVSFLDKEGVALVESGVFIGDCALTAGSWLRKTYTVTAPVSSAYGDPASLSVRFASSAAGYIDIDGIMVTEGSTVHAFKDGASEGCTWSGAQNNSYTQCIQN